MDKKRKVIPKYVYDEKLYEVAKAVLPVLYEKVDLKYMDKDNIYMHTSYTAISFAESFMEEFGYITEERAKETPPSSPSSDEPIMTFDQDSNITKIDLNQLKKEDEKKKA